MGCDIHMWAEIKKKQQWESVGKEFDNEWYDKERESKVDKDGYEWNPKKTSHPYDSRNYSLYAILADVRNGYGFAGCDTGDGFEPITEPRGIPDDAAPLFLAECRSWDCDGHSHGWITLQELLDYNWEQKTVRRGFVNHEQYQVFKEKGRPKSWCGGGNFTKVTNEEMETLIKEGSKSLQGHLMTQVEWEVSYLEEAGEDWWKAVETMKELAEDVGYDNFRIVFFFDN